ncbi:4-hydroxythreonine-4-phosphate dehydrogenase PdxA [Aureliella helgolandensis]|uniref:4-hydroxythreonine-4-phosphate dehydrogenase n=1 Tax=Aureliella helgolandensis TaxID=2527968 RepID=A0A518G793_9BACT|nr:4-hydroxythreonine-4-phosphate dehydrogenase PdxA [Aureliella helgolandensis]QDV24449.1 4-hydroxythreonine-4-phosphate dehydrogenase [Aureliella helgolandensis]
MRKPKIALTLGDPAGVGPELALCALSDQELLAQIDLVVIGNVEILQRCAQKLGKKLPQFFQLSKQQFLEGNYRFPSVVDLEFPGGFESFPEGRFPSGQLSASCGKAAFQYIQLAIDAALEGTVDAITTAPINKEALHLAGLDYPGHTEMFAERAKSERWCMMQYSEEITCSFVTVHVGYAEVPALITESRVLQTIELTAEALQKIESKSPHLVVCGLNPHAGENGLFGQGEEERAIIPAIARAREMGISIEGPLPPDTAFLPAKRRATDGFICMYHDQGHIPLKALAFDSAVNTTLGLPILRTSVDHGTAFDIAWKGLANMGSLYAALRLAAKLAPRP